MLDCARRKRIACAWRTGHFGEAANGHDRGKRKHDIERCLFCSERYRYFLVEGKRQKWTVQYGGRTKNEEQKTGRDTGTLS